MAGVVQGGRAWLLLLAPLLLLLHLLASVNGGAPPGPESVYNDAGFISVAPLGRRLFYWLFESRHQPDRDPLIVWLSGGPGCSSLLALFSENGPYQVLPQGRGLRLNPWAWNSNATVVWVDQPAGTGFSEGVPVHDEDQVAAHMLAFLHGLLRRYPHYRHLPLFVFGESYAGHYVPHLGAAILDDEEEKPKLNLRGIAIGNGLVDPRVQYRHYLPYALDHHLVDESQAVLMRAVLPLCEVLTLGCNVPLPPSPAPASNASGARALEWTACLNAYIFCNLGELLPVQSSGVNVYDVRQPCLPGQQLCYDFSDIEAYLNRQDVQEALLGPQAAGKKPWSECKPLVDLALVYGGDWCKGYERDVARLLDQGVPVLVYAGDQDFMCNHYGNRAWTQGLRWSGHQHFKRASNLTWRRGSDGSVGGYALGYGPLTFLQVLQAGHLVPMDQPQTALDMMVQFTTTGTLLPSNPPLLSDEQNSEGAEPETAS